MPIRCDRKRLYRAWKSVEWVKEYIYKIFIMRFQAGMLFLIVLVKWHICLLCGTLTDYHSVEYSVAYPSLYFILHCCNMVCRFSNVHKLMTLMETKRPGWPKELKNSSKNHKNNYVHFRDLMNTPQLTFNDWKHTER